MYAGVGAPPATSGKMALFKSLRAKTVPVMSLPTGRWETNVCGAVAARAQNSQPDWDGTLSLGRHVGIQTVVISFSCVTPTGLHRYLGR
jgi:hypothetical protein